MADSNAPTPLWRSTPDELWKPMDMVKRAKLFNELCRKVTPEAIKAENERTQPWEPLVTAPKSVVTPAPVSAAPIVPAERQLVKGEGTPRDFAKYRDEHGHNPIVGNPIESDFARRRAQGEYYRDTKRETPLVIKTVAAARKVFGSSEQIRTGGGYNTARRPVPATGNMQDAVQQRPTAPRPYNRPETPLHMSEGAQPARVLTPRKLDSYTLVNDIVRSNMPRDTQKFMLDVLIKYGRHELFPQAETPTTPEE